jgi:hypothetical protein
MEPRTGSGALWPVRKPAHLDQTGHRAQARIQPLGQSDADRLRRIGAQNLVVVDLLGSGVDRPALFCGTGAGQNTGVLHPETMLDQPHDHSMGPPRSAMPPRCFVTLTHRPRLPVSCAPECQPANRAGRQAGPEPVLKAGVSTVDRPARQPRRLSGAHLHQKSGAAQFRGRLWRARHGDTHHIAPRLLSSAALRRTCRAERRPGRTFPASVAPQIVEQGFQVGQIAANGRIGALTSSRS